MGVTVGVTVGVTEAVGVGVWVAVALGVGVTAHDAQPGVGLPGVAGAAHNPSYRFSSPTPGLQAGGRQPSPSVSVKGIQFQDVSKTRSGH